MNVKPAPVDLFILEESHPEFTGGDWRYESTHQSEEAARRGAKQRRQAGYDTRIAPYHRGVPRPREVGSR